MAGETIMVVDDDASLRVTLSNLLSELPGEVIEARDGKEALDLLAENKIDLILLDLDLPRISGMEVLRRTIADYPDVSVVIVSGKGTVSNAIEAWQIGAFDYLEKPIDISRTLITVRNALQNNTIKRQRDRLVAESHNRYKMIGDSAPMQKVYRVIDKAASNRSKVLITGRHGTGKEMVARAIHYNSDRAAGPFVAVNCAAIPENLIESELFGHEKGAFTNAVKSMPGKFEQADGGTLFLDEIGDMSMAAQTKTLRAIDQNEITRIGGVNTITVDTRIISATNKDIEAVIQDGAFREDLYYRLNVLAIHLPSLNDHREDIPALIEHFQTQYAEENGVLIKEIDPEALSLFVEYDWPGNIRQLKNMVERLTVWSEEDRISLKDAADILDKHHRAAEDNFHEARQRFERDFVVKTLVSNEWKIQATAHELGIDRSYLYKLMQRYGLHK